jgi:hypothetical protein
MNFQVVWAAIQPLLTQLLQSPAFQALVQKIFADINAKIAAGAHPTVVTNQAAGQIASGALLHLTGNFGADLQSFFAALKTPSVAVPPAPPPGPGTYTS